VSQNLTPTERSLRARAAAHARWANNDPIQGTAKALEAFLRSFIDKVDPDRILPEQERLRRAASARSAHFASLAYKSARARRIAAESLEK